jgi:hypothetical protein
LTKFGHAEAEPTRKYSSYRRDLWYCALQREGLDVGGTIELHARIVRYNERYTLEHYRALCYLDHWTKEDLSRPLQDLLEACPWSQEEISDFSRIHDEKEATARMLEDRLEFSRKNTDGACKKRTNIREMVGEK